MPTGGYVPVAGHAVRVRRDGAWRNGEVAFVSPLRDSCGDRAGIES